MTLFDLFEDEPDDPNGWPDADGWLDIKELQDERDRERHEDMLAASHSGQTDVGPTEVAEPVVTPPGWPEVEIRVSTRRKKTSEAKWVGGRIVVSLPAHLKGEARERTVAWLVDRLVSKRRTRTSFGDDQLMQRAVGLSQRYRLGKRPTSVRWVTNQNTRWGSCSYHSGEIRLSHRLHAVPEWVLDSVLVHEVAHLTHPNHSTAFHLLADHYPRHHEAGIFLAGYGLGLAGPEGAGPEG